MSTAEKRVEKEIKDRIQKGQFKEALFSCERWVQAFPKNGEAWFCKSVSEIQLQKFAEGLTSIKQAVALAPNDERFVAHHARALVCNGTLNEALKIAGYFKEHPSNNAKVMDAIGTVFTNAGEHEASLPFFQRAIELEPNIAPFHSNLGVVYHFLGQTKEAEKAHRKAIELKPDDYRAYWLLSQLKTASQDDNLIDWYSTALQKNHTNFQAQTCLNYALAKQYEDIKDYDASFHHLRAGAEATLERYPYNESTDEAMIEHLMDAFPKEYFYKPPPGSPSSEPLFIVGMPRTGTTLVEQIIASDEAYYPAGELHNFMHLFNQACLEANPEESGIRVYQNPERIDFAALGEAFIESTRPRTGHTPHFIDKYPLNFLMLGPLAAALSNAKFIHLNRNPMDTCLSNYKVLFMFGTCRFTYDLEDLGRYYLGYQKIMAHWRECLGGRLLDISYEALVTNPEAETKRLMAFLGIPWTEACLDFHKSNKAVATASVAQVRKPIYTSAVEKWRKFEKHLTPLMDFFNKNGIEIS